MDNAAPPFFNPYEPYFDLVGNLPHWRQQGVIYFVTFRAADSLPREKILRWVDERNRWMKANPQPWSVAQQREYHENFPKRLQKWLDAGYGECLLGRPEFKMIVENALKFHDKRHYDLDEYVVMPNHVHVLVAPHANSGADTPSNKDGRMALSKIIQSWKAYTAREIHARLGRRGSLWQKESYDHIVRSESALRQIRIYIRNNPRGGKVDATVPVA